MNYTNVIDFVLPALSVIGYVVLAIVIIVKKIKTKSTVKTDSGGISELFTLLNDTIGEMKIVEELYNKVFKEGIKAGDFKLRDVLNFIKTTCNERGINYDKDLWTEVIKLIVDFKNLTVQSTGQNSTGENNPEIFNVTGVEEK